MDQLGREVDGLKKLMVDENKKLGEISISLALREPVLFNKFFGENNSALLRDVDFKQNAQCKLSFYSWGELKLETSFKNNDFDIKNTDFVKIDKSAVENLEAFVKLEGKITGFDKDNMKFTWNVDLSKTPDEWLLFGGNKVENRFINICKILKCFNLKNEKFGLETCLKDNKFFGLDLTVVESLLGKDINGIVRELILTLFDGLKTLDDSVGVKYYSQLAGCEVLFFDKDKGLGNNDGLLINLVEPTNTK